MAMPGKLTDTELLGLISQTTQGSPNHDNNQDTKDEGNDYLSEKAQEYPSSLHMQNVDLNINISQTVTQSISSPVETVSQSGEQSSANGATQSGVKSSVSQTFHSQGSIESVGQNSLDKLGSSLAVKSQSYKLDAELVSMLSHDEVINLVHEYRTELEITKKKLEKSERKLKKANDYNDVLREMVEKLSSEIHQVKHGKSCSVHVQVDKADFLDYTTGRNTMPKWNTEDEHNSASMDVGQTGEVAETPDIPVQTSTQQPEAVIDSLSIADSIKQAAEAVVQQQQANMLHDQGYVYDEHSGLYYHSASGYYYDQHKSLFYDPKTGIYYYYDYDTGEYMFHSQIELPTGNQDTEHYAMNEDTPLKKRFDTKKSTKLPKKKRRAGRQSSEERVFKNRKERRKAELENLHKRRRKHREHRFIESGSKDRGRKRHSDNRSHRSTELHDRDKRKERSRRKIAERKVGNRKYSKVSESKSEASDFEIKDDDLDASEHKSRKREHSRTSVDKSKAKGKESSGRDRLLRLSKEDEDAVYDLVSENELMINEDVDEGSVSDAIIAHETDDETNETGQGKEKAVETEEIGVRSQCRADKSRKHSHRRRSSDRKRHYNEIDSKMTNKAKSSYSEEDDSEVESGELSDSESELLTVSESYSSFSSETSEDDMYIDLVENEDNQQEKEVAGSYPPCIRVIVMESDCLAVGTLFIVTCTGAKIGRENCDICVPDFNVSKVHAEIRYNESGGQYEIFDLASQNGTFLNSQRLSPAKIASEPLALSHDDNVLVSNTTFLCHIHSGYDTCDQCEPGVVIATHKAQQPQTEIKVLSKEERLRKKKQELNQIKKKYGLKNSAYENNQEVFNNPNYADKAEERRKVVGSDVPGQKQAAPSSVHRPISAGNVGHKMLQKMGWKEGDSLGKDNKGIQEPISVTFRASQKAGLGSASAGAFSAEDANTVDMKKANRRIQAQQRYNSIETPKGNSEGTTNNKHWIQGDTELT